jgi:mannose-1-phosphate guanylyltransferase
MKVSLATKPQERAAIILAGGEGTRLRALTRKIAGVEVPKQFCPVIGQTTLLQQTFERTSLSVAPERILTVVTRAHEPFYRHVLADYPEKIWVVQPESRGTGAAILYGLLRLCKLRPNLAVAVLPSDHFVSDNSEFMRRVDLAFDAIRDNPDAIVILGVRPVSGETGYGWIEPGERLGVLAGDLLRVRRFWEKPPAALAQDLMLRGCLWNSFVMVANRSGLLRLYSTILPRVFARFLRVLPELGTRFEELEIERLYWRLAPIDFSRDLLARNPASLAVLPIDGVQWSDLGEPERVMDVLALLGKLDARSMESCCGDPEPDEQELPK